MRGRFTGPAEDMRIFARPFYGPGRGYEHICVAVLEAGRGYEVNEEKHEEDENIC